MQLISLCPLAASTLLWRTANGPCVTVAVKATFQLSPDDVAALAAPLPLFHDVFHEQNAGRSLYVASDAVPHKPRADVLLTGSAYAPLGQHVSHRWVRLAVFDAQGQVPAVDKRLQVVGERQRDPATGQATAPAPFSRLPVRYELAFGGARCPENPVGRGADPADLRLPSLLNPAAPDTPDGFGPLSSAWPQRRRALGAWDPAKLLLPVPELPTAMDWGYFNAAPRDQQIPYLRGDEWILLEGLHPTAAQVRSRLPGLRARVLLRAPRLVDPAGVELTVRCDTLWIDADALRCTLTWRASLAVAERALEIVERGSLLVTLALPGERVAWPAPEPAAAAPPPVGATTAPLPEGVRPPAAARPSLPIPAPDPSAARGMSAEEWAARGAGAEPGPPSLDLTQTRPLDPAAFAEALQAFDPAPPGAAAPEASGARPGATEAPGGAGAPSGATPGAAEAAGVAGGAPASRAPGQPAVLVDTREFNLQDVLRGARQEDAPFPLAPPGTAAQAEGARAPAEVSLEALRQAFPAMAAHIAAHGGAPLPTATLPLPEPEPSKPTSEDLAGSPDLPPPARTTEHVPILNLTPFAAFTVPWQARPPRDSLTVVVKGTFDLVPGAPAAIAADQQLPGGDVHVDDDPEKSLRYPSDFAIFKPKADVLLVGHAHRASAGDAAALVRLRLGDALDRSVAAIGPRRWDALGAPTAPEPWDRIPLRFESAFGGAGYGANPVGTGHGARAGGALPSLEQPDRLIRSSGDRPSPACFAPIAATWIDRLKKIGSYGERWRRTRWPFFPDDFDWTFFNAAPAEQQIAYPRGDEPFELWSVRPEGEVVRGRLPELRVRVFKQATEKAGGGFSEVPMRLDTVWFDADALRLVLVWRGLLDVADEDASEIASLFVLSEPIVKGGAKSEPTAKGDARARFFAELAAREAAETPAAGEEGAANDTTAEEGDSALDARLAEALAQARARRRAAVGGGAAAAAAAAVGAIAEPAAAAAQGEGDAPPREAAPGDPVEAPPPAGREAILELLRLGEPLAGVDLTGIDLSGADLAGADLGGVLLKRANLRGARLDGARLVEAVLAEADGEGASFEGADLTRADLTGANLKAARLAGAVLELAAAGAARCDGAAFDGIRAPGASFAGATLAGACFDRADLTGAEMMQAVLDGASFRDATLDDVKIYGATGTRVTLDGASLADLRADDVVLRSGSFRRASGPGSVWEGADLTGADFAGAALREASFTRATLDGATFDAADLVDGRFRKARLRGAHLRQANLMRAAFDGADLEGADLRGANLYQAETWKARTAGSRLAEAFLAGTKLEER